MHSSINPVQRKGSVLCLFVNIRVLRRCINSFKFPFKANVPLVLLTGTVHFEKLKVKCSEGHTGDGMPVILKTVYVFVSLTKSF